jgi:hypothetical protein
MGGGKAIPSRLVKSNERKRDSHCSLTCLSYWVQYRMRHPKFPRGRCVSDGFSFFLSTIKYEYPEYLY